ncbi:MAG: RimK/LysX family protein [Nanobdellota archaeon]
MGEKNIIGLTEEILVKGRDKEKKVMARIDTGATKSSIDSPLAAELNLGPVIGTKVVKSAHGISKRPLVEASVIMGGKEIKGEFSIAVREHLKYQVLIGQNLLKKGYLIDPSK